ncbi:MAG: hypothetical protein WHV61_09235, partial [Burkholderiales bacterium]
PRGVMLDELLERWQPDLVLAAAQPGHGPGWRARRDPPCDVLLVRLPPPRTLTGRLVRALAAAL